MFFLIDIFCQNVSFFMNFNIFSSKFRKIKISRDSGGVRSSALDMFYLKDNTFDFFRKIFFGVFFVEKKSVEKISIFLCEILDFWKFPNFQKINKKMFFFFEISGIPWVLTPLCRFRHKNKVEVKTLRFEQLHGIIRFFQVK